MGLRHGGASSCWVARDRLDKEDANGQCIGSKYGRTRVYKCTHQARPSGVLFECECSAL